ncbi:unnamed protein product [Bursaphelenchus okinawaensis]|uniref:guanylate kinase n=1 Tax=Bursaphelenchus okinawaensis TaxID=465554 RepID=A0A811JQD8_9BILA|nr:unnamed protein product [Bursaphelenchus okinawaensis]CAG9078174.1 unnamed protein product [Bursaphelenchus okinawaensis]
MTTKIRPIVMTGASGTGKSTLLNRAQKEYPDAFAFSVSHTTRQPRDGEVHGVNYYFVDRAEIEKMIENDEFVENVEFGGNRYGTSKMAIENVQKSGKICVLDLDLNGVRSLKDHHMNFKFILVKAPSMEILEQRLRGRGTETEETIQNRLRHAREDNEAAEREPDLFDRVIINSQLDQAYEEFISAIREELDQYEAFKRETEAEQQPSAEPVSVN